MRNTVRTILAVAVIIAALGFTAVGVARAASGFVRETLPRLTASSFTVTNATETPEPTETVVTAEPTDTAEPTGIDETETPGVEETTTPEPGSTEIENDDSQEDSNAQGQDEDSGHTDATPHPEQNHPGSGDEGGGGD